MTRDLLFLAHRIPFPPDKGDKIRSFHALKHLAEAGRRVHLCALVDDPDDLRHRAALEGLCASVFLQPLSPRLQRAASVFGPARGLPLSVPYFYRPQVQRRVDELLRDVRPQAVYCVCSPMAEYVFRSKALSAASGRLSAGRGSESVSPHPGAGASPRLVMDLMDVDSDKWVQYAGFRRWPLSWVYRAEGALLARYERRVAERFDAVTLVSPAEAELFGRRCGLPRKVHAVGNGVDLEYFCPASQRPSVPASRHEDAPRTGQGGPDCAGAQPPGLVFCGAMDYFPNVDAVVWFAREVLPLIRQSAGDVTFTVVGSKPADEVRALEGLPGVRVTGRVEDVRPFVWGAALSVAPIRIARGVQNKVLEAMAMARPVVSTPQAFEGIEAQAGEDLVVAHADPRAFAEAVSRLLADVGRAEALGGRGRAAVEARYAWSAQMQRLEELLP